MRRVTTLVCSTVIALLLVSTTVFGGCGHTGSAPCTICDAQSIVVQPKTKAKKATQKLGVPSAGFGFLDIVELVLAKSTGLGLERLF
jgi:hypothetical protein